MRMQNKLGAAVLAAALLGAGAAPAAAQKSADTLRIAMRDALPNIDPYYNNLRTGVVMHHQGWDALVYRNPGYVQARAAARHRVEAAGCDHDRVHAAAGREVPRRQPVYGRRRGLHHQPRGRSGQQGVDAVELQLDRQGREDRRPFGARQAEAAEPGGAGIFRARDADLSQGLSREGRRRKATPRRRSAPARTRSPRSSPASPSTSSASRTTGPAAPRASPRSRR